MFELLLPVALGVLGGGIGLALASKGRRNRQEILREADALQAQGNLREAVRLLEQALAEAQPSETEFLAEVRYRLCALYPALRLWTQGEEACRALLVSAETLGPSGRHDVLRHLAHCLDAQSRSEEAAAARAQADSLIEEIPDTAYRLFARQERLVRHGEYAAALPLQEELLASHAERISLPTLLCYTAFTAQHAGYPQDARRYVAQTLEQPGLAKPLRYQAHQVGYHATEALSDWPELLTHARALHSITDTPTTRAYLATALLLNDALDACKALLTPEDLGLGITLARLRQAPATALELLAKAAPGPRTDQLHVALALETGDGAEALSVLERLGSDSPLAAAQRAWARALLSIAEELPEPEALMGEPPAALEAWAMANWHQGRHDGALALQRQLVSLPLAPAFLTYQRRQLQVWQESIAKRSE